MTITEYAVRRVCGSDVTTIPVGDEVLMRQTVAELIERGERAEPLTRQVPEWTVDQATLRRVQQEVHREHVLSVADRVWGEKITPEQGVTEIRDFLPAELAAEVTTERLAELVTALDYQQRVDNDEVWPDPAEGEDKQLLQERAEGLVREAADALIGGEGR